MSDSRVGEPRMFIDGELVDAASGATFENVNPASEEVIGHTADGGPEDMERAIAAARRAFDEGDWSTRRELRIERLRQLRAALLDEKESLRQQTVAEGGCPLQLTYGPQGDSVIDGIEWSIENLERYAFERDLGVHRFFGIASRRMVWKEPIGVVGAITPWNFPLQVNLAKSIPALAAGCTVVLKPAPDTPWNATFLGRIAAERTDMPPGVFNVVTSSHPARVGQLLAREFGPRNIRINAIAPGPTDTEATRRQVHPSIIEGILSQMPLRRMGEPADMVGALKFLLSDDARWITGHVLNVDGGQVMRV